MESMLEQLLNRQNELEINLKSDFKQNIDALSNDFNGIIWDLNNQIQQTNSLREVVSVV